MDCIVLLVSGILLVSVRVVQKIIKLHGVRYVLVAARMVLQAVPIVKMLDILLVSCLIALLPRCLVLCLIRIGDVVLNELRKLDI